MQHSNAEFSDDSSGNLPDFGTYSLSVKNHLFFREIQAVQGLVLEDKVRAHRGLHGVNHCVTSDENLSLDGLPP